VSGPPPKVDRVRRAAPVRGEYRPASGAAWSHGPVPELPEGLTPASIEAWRVWFVSWPSSFWTAGDLPALRQMIRLYDQVERGGFVRAGELRLWLGAFGLTPAGQQSLRWRPPTPTELPATRDRPTYAHLHVVNPKVDPA